MGKYMRKTKTTSDIAAMELSQSSLSVCTRAQALALRRLQATNPPDDSSSSYLQLRNRRLEKPINAVKQQKSAAKQSCRQNPEPNFCPRKADLRMKSRLRSVNSGSGGSDSISILEASKEEAEDLGVEDCFGETNLEFDGRERGTRESTPCNLIRASLTTESPASCTRPTLTVSNQRSRNSTQRDIPNTQEMEEFFAFSEQEEQRRFTEKYNFDVVNDLPLPGRYEWVRAYP